MRTLGEQRYRDWHIERIQETNITLYLFCLFGQAVLIAGVGGAVVLLSLRAQARDGEPELLAIGLGIIAYAAAVTFYTLLGVIRLRRADKENVRKLASALRDNDGTRPKPVQEADVLS
jgi:heme A synthase